MKIAIVIERYNPLRGGAERSSMEMAAALARCGLDVSIVAGRVEKNKEIDYPEGVSIVDLGVKGGRNIWFNLFDAAASKYFSDNKYDIIHSITPISVMDVYQPRAGSQLHALRRHLKQYKFPVSIIKKLTAGLNHARGMRLKAERTLCTKTDGPIITVLSDYVGRQFIADYGVSNDRLKLIRNAIDIGRFNTDDIGSKCEKLRKRFDPDNNLAIMLHVSEDPARKGMAELIQAMAYAKSNRPAGTRDFRLLVVGSFDYSKYYNMVRRYNLEGSVVFFGPSREVPTLMKMADCLILPTWDDACSRVVMEALAAGIPAISTSYNGASELFSCGRYGIEVESPADTTALARAINRVSDADECRSMKDAISVSGLIDSLSMDRHASELLKLYKYIGELKGSNSVLEMKNWDN